MTGYLFSKISPLYMANKKYRIHLSESERHWLSQIVDQRSKNSHQSKRAYALLGMDESGPHQMTDQQASSVYRLSIPTLERLRKRVHEHGVEVAVNGVARKPQAPHKFDGKVEAHLVALRCSTPPEGHGSWTLRLLADQMVELGYVESISHEQVRKMLKKTKSSPGESNPG